MNVGRGYWPESVVKYLNSYGQDKVVRIGFQKYGKLVLLKSKGTLVPTFLRA